MNQTRKENVFLRGTDLRHMLLEACKYFQLYKESINDLNVFPVPDGDTGTNMSLTMMAAAKELQKLESNSIGEISRVAAHSSLMGARGNSGVILSQLFRGIARGLSGKDEASLSELGKAFQYGIVYAYNAVTKPVEGTILTVAREIAKGSREAMQGPLEFTDLLRIAIESGRKALDRTPELLPVLKEAGVVDAGGLGLIVFLEGCLQSMLERTAEEQLVVDPENEEQSAKEILPQQKSAVAVGAIWEEFDPNYPYCTELIIKGSGLEAGKLRKSLAEWGDSLIVAGEDIFAKVHIHTSHPGSVLERCLLFGSIHDVKIENMLDQFKETHWSRAYGKEKEKGRQEDLPSETKLREAVVSDGNIAVITISSGEGLSAIFSSLGADRIISGGQSMNPSVSEIVDAIEEVPSNDVIILPNNSNIRLSAQQAAELVEKEVMVVDTRSLPQGLAALLALNKKKTLLENHTEMSERAQQVKTGEITYATRDAVVNNIKVTKGSIIGISGGSLLVSGRAVNNTTFDLARTILSEKDEVLTLFYGRDVSRQQANEMAELLKSAYPNLLVDLHYGGQPLYYYLLSIE